MAGIVARMPGARRDAVRRRRPLKRLSPRRRRQADISLEHAGRCWSCLFVAVVVGVIAITKGQRRIPTQSAKHVRGRRVYGGTRQYLPLRVNQAGVMPIIFASSAADRSRRSCSACIASVSPAATWAADARRTSFSTRPAGGCTTSLYIVLIYFFCYFWTAITFNPKDMANNLKDYGSFIPGYRPGQADGRLPGEGDDADHLRRGGVPGARRDHPDASIQRGHGRRPHDRQLPTAAPAC